MAVDPLLLARIQIGATLSAAVLFATTAVGLAWMLAALALRNGADREPAWRQGHALWSRFLALSFALAAIAVAAARLQIEADWRGLQAAIGNVAATLVGEDLPAVLFFAEIALLGVVLFGPGRLPHRAVTAATVLAAAAATALAVPLVALAAWTQTPAGFEMAKGVARLTNLQAAFLNPSFPYRLAHLLIASLLSAAFLMAGFSAWRQRRGDGTRATATALRAGVAAAALLAPLQMFSGYLHGGNTLLYQPAKIAAIAANWTSRGHAPLVLFGWPDEAELTTHGELSIPDGASLILRHRADGVVPGIDNYRGEHPPVVPVFLAFRAMAGIGLAMLVVSWVAAWFLFRRDRLPGAVASALVAMTFAGGVATLAGCWTAGIGRQPWAVAEILRTADAGSAASLPWAALSLAGWLALTGALVAIWLGALWRLANDAPTRHPT